MDERSSRQLDELKQLQIDYRVCFASEHGRRVLDDLRKRGFFDQVMFEPEDAFGRTIIFREGRRSLVLHIDHMMNVDVERLIAMRKESEDHGRE